MKLPTLKIKRLHSHAIIPQRMTKGSVGLDVYISHGYVFFPHTVTVVHTGIALAIPRGYHGEVHIRSSWGRKGIRLANCTGIIDSDYRGELVLLVINDVGAVYHAPEGSRLAQLVLVKDPAFKIEEVKELDETERGVGGFGSTDEENKGDK